MDFVLLKERSELEKNIGDITGRPSSTRVTKGTNSVPPAFGSAVSTILLGLGGITFEKLVCKNEYFERERPSGSVQTL